MVRVLFSASPELWADYQVPLTRAIAGAGVTAEVVRAAEPASIDYVVFAPGGPVSDFTPFARAKAVLGLWAGVESIVGNRTLTQPLTRMVDPGLAQGMAEWVTGHVLRHHLGLDADIGNTGSWAPRVPPLANDRVVGILGMGALGTAAAASLQCVGFSVRGWARRPRPSDSVPIGSGEAGLCDLLGAADILVLLLPLTQATECLMNARRFAAMKPGAVLLNPGRGALIDDAALLAALDAGQIAHATLDVFRTEPLPADHPFWRHRGITVTPHIASATRPATAARVIAENVRRGEAGEPLLHLVDRSTGY